MRAMGFVFIFMIISILLCWATFWTPHSTEAASGLVVLLAIFSIPLIAVESKL